MTEGQCLFLAKSEGSFNVNIMSLFHCCSSLNWTVYFEVLWEVFCIGFNSYVLNLVFSDSPVLVLGV